MAKKLKARESIGKKESEIFGGKFQQRFFVTIFNKARPVFKWV
jgi:hypothetical protein